MNTSTHTLQIARELKALKFSDAQSEGLAEIVGAIDEKRRDELVTRDYLRAEIGTLRSEIYRAMMIQTGVTITINTGILALFFSLYG